MIGVETLSLLHFITGTEEEMEGNIMGEVEEERNEVEEEQRVGEEVMEEMEEEGRKRKKGSAVTVLSPPPLPSPLFLFPLLLSSPLSSSSLPSPSFLSPLLLSSPLFSPPLPSSPLLSLHLPSLSRPLSTSWRLFLPHTDTTEQNKSKL